MKRFRRLLCLGLCAVMAISVTACKNTNGGDTGDDTSSKATSSTSSKTEKPKSGTYFDTDIWESVPMVNKAQKDKGIAGGEGCQWQLSLAFDQVDGKLAFFGTDVGGIYKSTDGGKSWIPATIGWLACGGTGIQIDPNNTNRVIGIGCNSMASNKNGPYLSTDAGETWKQTMSAMVVSYRDYRRQIAFDPTSKDDKIGGSKIVYWSRDDDKYNSHGEEVKPCLYKSEDGGESWKELPNTADYGGAEIAVNPKNGTLYVANQNGFFKSTDGGKTFKKTVSEGVASMTVIKSKPDNVYIAKADGVYVSTNSGDSFTNVSEDYGFTSPFYLSVSPADPNRMMLQNFDGGNESICRLFYSHDGGKTFTRCDKDNENGKPYRWPENTWIPYCFRQNPTAFHPTDKNIVLTYGGDFVMRSTDGGKSFKWSNNGYTGMMTGGKIKWNVNDPNLMMNPSQDYNGGFTTDGGKTWNYIQWYSDWGGFTYGGYTLTNNISFVGVRDGMSYFGPQDQRYLAITFDGGKTVEVKKDVVLTGYEVGMGVPGDNNVAFMAEWRTEDQGKTWSKMENCTGVFTADPTNGTLYGSNGYEVVKSTDKGKTWEKVAIFGGATADIAINHETQTLYVLAGGSYAYDLKTKKRTQLRAGGSSVAVDPSNPEIVYIVGASNTEQNQYAVQRSLDGGKTWTNLTRSVGDGRKGPDGGKEATTVAVHAKTGEVFVGTCCRGMWKIPAPPKDATK